jgi:hypothetical protein
LKLFSPSTDDACARHALAAVAATPAVAFHFGATATVDVDAGDEAHVVEIRKVSKLDEVPALAPVVDRIL